MPVYFVTRHLPGGQSVIVRYSRKANAYLVTTCEITTRIARNEGITRFRKPDNEADDAMRANQYVESVSEKKRGKKKKQSWLRKV